MKKVLITMLVMFLLIVWPFGGIWWTILHPILGGGVEQSFIYPLYGGIILLSGLIVGCTVIIIEEIRAVKKGE